MFGSQWHQWEKHEWTSSRGEVKRRVKNGRLKCLQFGSLICVQNLKESLRKFPVHRKAIILREETNARLVCGGTLSTIGILSAWLLVVPYPFPCTAHGLLMRLAGLLGLVLFRRLKTEMIVHRWIHFCSCLLWLLDMLYLDVLFFFSDLKNKKGILKEIFRATTKSERTLAEKRPIGRLKTLLKCQTSIKLVLTLFNYF